MTRWFVRVRDKGSNKIVYETSYPFPVNEEDYFLNSSQYEATVTAVSVD